MRVRAMMRVSDEVCVCDASVMMRRQARAMMRRRRQAGEAMTMIGEGESGRWAIGRRQGDDRRGSGRAGDDDRR